MRPTRLRRVIPSTSQLTPLDSFISLPIDGITRYLGTDCLSYLCIVWRRRRFVTDASAKIVTKSADLERCSLRC